MNPEILNYALRPPHLPKPWKTGSTFAVGGLQQVGFAPGRDLLLVGSMDGFGLFDTVAGRRIARDGGLMSTAEEDRSLVARGFDVLEGETIPMAGLWGGGLRRQTADWFYLSAQAPHWPDERVVMDYPDGSREGRGRSRALVVGDLVTELRAYGFSDTGRSFVVACASDLFVFVRDES